MKRDPNHLGALHYYIHTVEASNTPERALPAANRLAALAPGAGHIVHMPAHVYIRTGDYAAATKTNEQAAAVDRAYIKSSGVQGIYPMMYYSHNLHFIAMCSAMTGDYTEARKAAEMLAAHVAPFVKEMLKDAAVPRSLSDLKLSGLDRLNGFLSLSWGPLSRFRCAITGCRTQRGGEN